MPCGGRAENAGVRLDPGSEGRNPSVPDARELPERRTVHPKLYPWEILSEKLGKNKDQGAFETKRNS